MAQNPSATQSDELRDIIVELARTQLAAVTAALRFWGGWVQSADKYTHRISAELEKIKEGHTVPDKFVGQLTDLSREYFREIVALPKVAAENFTSEMDRISKPKTPPKRTRKARAKE
jgi:hypothetical protein